MLISPEELSKFSGRYPDDDSLQKVYINSAYDIIAGYVGYTPEDNSDFEQELTDTIIVYSTDGETFYSDSEFTHLATIPDGCIPIQTLYENQWQYEYIHTDIVVPDVFKLVNLEIATLMQQEEQQNIGINNKSFGDSGSRSFLNVVDYGKYLNRLAKYRNKDALEV